MIVVTCPTGQIGRQVVDNLLADGAAVRVVVRDPARLSDRVRGRVEVVRGSHSDVAVVSEAFAGAEAVFWLVPPNPRAASLDDAYLGFSRAACAAFLTKGVRRVVGVSALGRGTAQGARAGLVTASLAMDDMIAGTGVPYRALTMPSFMDNILRQVVPIRDQGLFLSPISGARKMPVCATRDIAAVAARLLRAGDWQGRGDVPVLGPEDMSFDDMARVISDVLGRVVRFRQISFDAYRARFIELGMSEAFAQGMTDMASAKNDGLDNAEPRTPENTTPTGFRQWCDDTLKSAVTGI